MTHRHSNPLDNSRNAQRCEFFALSIDHFWRLLDSLDPAAYSVFCRPDAPGRRRVAYRSARLDQRLEHLRWFDLAVTASEVGLSVGSAGGSACRGTC